MDGKTETVGILASIDYSLKLQEQNKQVVMNPIVALEVDKLSDRIQIEAQVKEFKEKWKKYYEQGDRYFSPNLSKKETGLAIACDEKRNQEWI